MPGIGADLHTVDGEFVVPEARLIAPPELGPFAVRPGPDDGEIVDDAVAVVVVLREVVTLGVVVGEDFLDECLPSDITLHDF